MGKTLRTIIQQTDDIYGPPGAPVLEVDIIGPDVFLTISDLEETNTTSTYTRIATAQVPLRDLARALDTDVFFHTPQEPEV